MSDSTQAQQPNYSEVRQIGQFFSFEGRVPRAVFWVNGLIFAAINVIMSLVFVETYVSPFTLETHTDISYRPLYFALSLVVGVRWLSVVARRWHDLNKSGWLAIIVLGPVFGMFFPGVAAQVIFSLVIGLTMFVALGFLGFVPGEDGDNDYGPPPDEGQWF